MTVCVLSMCNVPAVTREWQTSVRCTENPRFYLRFLEGCHTTVTAVTLWFHRCTPYHWESVSSLFFASLFLFVSWLTEWVSRRLCCVVFDSSLGAELSLIRLLGPTVFLKSVSINIIMLCSRHHWIFYCNVLQNITTPPPAQSHTEKVSPSDGNFSFWLKGLCGVCFISGSFCVFVVFSFLVL